METIVEAHEIQSWEMELATKTNRKYKNIYLKI
jgi:hypothetical protein